MGGIYTDIPPPRRYGPEYAYMRLCASAMHVEPWLPVGHRIVNMSASSSVFVFLDLPQDHKIYGNTERNLEIRTVARLEKRRRLLTRTWGVSQSHHDTARHWADRSLLARGSLILPLPLQSSVRVNSDLWPLDGRPGHAHQAV